MNNGNKQDITSKSGKAYLVGAGPGRADLITVRGLNLLRQADVVLYDRLIAQELLHEIRPEATAIFVGKKPNKHMVPQPEINRLLVEYVSAGCQVVRLKGGDPLMFGRGGEEILALSEAGLPFEIVPGVSSIIAAPAYAGVPLTQRGLVSYFAVATGHEDPTKPASTTDWNALARMPTLVLLMAIKRIAAITQSLIEAGRDPGSPAVIISWATTDEQTVFRATLETLPNTIVQHKVQTPAVIVIGQVAELHDRLAWFEPEGQSAGFVSIPPANQNRPENSQPLILKHTKVHHE